jgi:DNA polymerase III subunit delta'
MRLLLHPIAEVQVTALQRSAGGTILLHGPAQVGKFTTALEVARVLNCEGCSDGSCRSCRMAAGGNHPNILIIRPDDKQKIGVEPIHELQHSLRYRQYEASGERVVIIAKADRLTLPAEHALLKTLEEPPAGTTIILTSEYPTSLLPTVLSRCRLIFLPPLAVADIETFLREQEQVSAAAATTAAATSHGLAGRAVAYVRDPARLAEDQERAATIRELLAADSLFSRLLVAVRVAAGTQERTAYLAELALQVRAAARADAAAGYSLAAVERLQLRLQANVNAKTAFEALAVELT